MLWVEPRSSGFRSSRSTGIAPAGVFRKAVVVVQVERDLKRVVSEHGSRPKLTCLHQLRIAALTLDPRRRIMNYSRRRTHDPLFPAP
jgi:hypothetical protein